MKKESYSYSFISSKKSEEIFELLSDVRQWWTGFYQETIKGKSEKVNDEFTFTAGGGVHSTKQKLIELIPDKKIVWLVIGSKLTFLSDPCEWLGTKISFDISAKENKTKVTFTHEGLTPQIECYKDCSHGWSAYLGKLEQKLR